jgi:hypothetical protein
MALELLLRMHAEPKREWAAVELSRELRAAPDWIARELQDFAQRGLVAAIDTHCSTF